MCRIIVLNALILYPFLELTRLIVWYSETYGVLSEFWVELVAFWGSWVVFNLILIKEMRENGNK